MHSAMIHRPECMQSPACLAQVFWAHWGVLGAEAGAGEGACAGAHCFQGYFV